MTNAEHLIENAISAIGRHEDIRIELNKPYNKIMLAESRIEKDDVVAMANHIVYTLYEGLNPFGEHFDEVMDYYHYLKEQDHAPKWI